MSDYIVAATAPWSIITLLTSSLSPNLLYYMAISVEQREAQSCTYDGRRRRPFEYKGYIFSVLLRHDH